MPDSFSILVTQISMVPIYLTTVRVILAGRVKNSLVTVKNSHKF